MIINNKLVYTSWRTTYRNKDPRKIGKKYQRRLLPSAQSSPQMKILSALVKIS